MSDILKKFKARKIRKNYGATYLDQGSGEFSSTPLYEGHQPSTHLMTDDIIGNTSGEYHVWPSIGKDSSGNWTHQSGKDAFEKGEVFTFKNQKKAEKFAQGSWKKGKAHKYAMKEYKENKKQE